MPLTAVNMIISVSWTLQAQTAFGPKVNGPNSEQFTLAQSNLVATWTQLLLYDLTIWPSFTFTGSTHTTTTVDGISGTDIAKLKIGQLITNGANFSPGTYITAVGASSITINQAAIATNAGITINNQAAPYGASVTPAAGTSTFSNTTYYWKITALGGTQTGVASSETLPSTEVSSAITGTGQVANLSWTGVTGAVGYNIYRGTVSGSENTLAGTVLSPNGGLTAPATTFTDTGGGTAQSPPGSTPNNFIEFDISSFTNNVGETVAPTKALGIEVITMSSYSDSLAQCQYAPGSSNGLSWFLSGTTPAITIPLGGAFALSGPATGTGQTIDSTHKTIRITNPGYGPLNVIVAILCHP